MKARSSRVEKMKFVKIIGWAVGVILVAFGIMRIPYYLPIPENQFDQAVEGVTENSLWTPVVRSIDGFNMALVPSGCFEMGSTDAQLEEAYSSCESYYGALGCQEDFSNEQPSHMVCISQPFWIDETSVTNRQYGSDSRLDSSFPQKESNWPREAVTWEMASDFCAQRNGRLPTEAEWEYASRGPDSLIYPFGNTYDIHLVTLRKISPAPVNEKPEGASWVGAQDMSGGIAEWVYDWYGPYSSNSQTDPTGPVSGAERIVKGGSWFAHAAYFVRAAYREPLDPDFSSSMTGFRCVRDFQVAR